MVKKKKKKIFNKNNLVIVASIFATFSIILFYFASIQTDYRNYNLFVRDQYLRNIQFLAENNGNLKTVWQENGTLLSEEIKESIKEEITKVGDSGQRYIEFGKKEKLYKNLGMLSIVLSIVMNAIALRLKK